ATTDASVGDGDRPTWQVDASRAPLDPRLTPRHRKRMATSRGPVALGSNGPRHRRRLEARGFDTTSRSSSSSIAGWSAPGSARQTPQARFQKLTRLNDPRRVHLSPAIGDRPRSRGVERVKVMYAGESAGR
ncbi:MAG: hypothetical protein ACRDMZ_23535, partial [Solirubrobacteraceae bacterium]